jgi:hypothetical protein
MHNTKLHITGTFLYFVYRLVLLGALEYWITNWSQVAFTRAQEVLLQLLNKSLLTTATSKTQHGASKWRM